VLLVFSSFSCCDDDENLFETEPLFEVTALVISNIVCFRYNPGDISEEDVEKLNKKIMDEIWKLVFGRVIDTTLNGVYMLRACSVNHRTRKEDYDYLFTKIKEIAADLSF